MNSPDESCLDPEVDFLFQLFGGDDLIKSDIVAAELEFIQHLKALLASKLHANLVPRLSGSLPRLLASLRKGDRIRQISDQIAGDPEVLANIMRAVNSPFYRLRSKKIESVDQALVILGEKGIREVIAAVTMKPIMTIQSNEGIDSALWDDSTKCAAVCRMLSDGAGSEDSFSAYLSGLMHSVGLIAILRQLAKATLPLKSELSKPFTSAFVRELRKIYPRPMQIAMQWELSEESLKIFAAFASDNQGDSPSLEILREAIFLTRANTLWRHGHYVDNDIGAAIQGEHRQRIWRKKFNDRTAPTTDVAA